MTNVLMISTDAKILEEGSPVRARMAEYGALFGELHIVVFAKRSEAPSIQEGRSAISKNTFAYPTASVSKLWYVRDATRIGASIVSSARLAAADSVITTQDPFETGLVGARLSKKTGVPLHVQIHTDFHSPYFKDSILNRIRTVIADKVFPRASAIRAVSERICASLPADARQKASVLPIFADIASIRGAAIDPTADLRKRYPQFGKIVLMASRLTKEKDFSTALEAFALALKSAQVSGARGLSLPAGLVIVGAGPEEGSIRSRISSLGLDDRVVIEPWADRATIVSYMKTCDVFLSASRYEGYGLSMLEAHAAGATVVATDAGIASELAGSVAAPGDADALAANLSAAISGRLKNKPSIYPYPSKEAYLEAFKKDIDRALGQPLL